MASAIFATVGLGLSIYLSWAGLTGSSVAGCDGGTFDCNHVLTSRWSKVATVPVGVPASVMYMAVLSGLAVVSGSSTPSKVRIAERFLYFAACAIAAAAIWFISLQFLAVGQLCVYCVAAHVCGLAFAGITLFRHAVPTSRAIVLAGLGLASVVALAVVQWQSPLPKTYRIERHQAPPMTAEPTSDGGSLFAAPGDDGITTDDEGSVFAPPVGDSSSQTDEASGTSADSDDAIFEAPTADPESSASDSIGRGSSIDLTAMSVGLSLFGVIAAPQESGGKVDREATSKPDSRLVPVSSGRRQLRIDEWPLWGKADADKAVAMMFDYTCSHCRNTHQAIRKAKASGNLDIAVVALPTPLHRSCNDAAKSNDPSRADACEIARIAVALWLADADKFTTFHDWLLESQRSAADARAEAERLVGREALAEKLAKDTPSKYIEKNVFLYKEAGAGTLPKLVFPSTTVVGEVSSPTTISNLIRSNAK